MYFAKLCDITSDELKTAVSDVTIAILGWYTNIQQRAIQDAGAITGLNAPRLINNTTATALSWGITKTDLLDPENPCNIMFINLAVSDSRKFSQPNTEAPLNIESIMNNINASSKFSHDEYEQLIAPVLKCISGPLEPALTESGLTVNQIDAVELIGGLTHVPTMHAIARGTTFACAFFSPTFCMHELHMRDMLHYPIQVYWQHSKANLDDDPSSLVGAWSRNQTHHLKTDPHLPMSTPAGP
ncbi:Hsp70 protein-domain-containing protein [Melanogaster broomeanus]|nr:Hsp70 protein-domain-containing protein [Melanogaster broomeanus]